MAFISRPGQKRCFEKPLAFDVDHSDVVHLQSQLYGIEKTLAVSGSNLLDFYAAQLRERPVLTKASTAAILGSLGDAIAQSRSKQDFYDPKRGMTFLLFGALYTGAFQHVWFGYLSSHVADWGEAAHLWGHPESSREWWRFFDLSARLKADNSLPPPSLNTLSVAKVAINQVTV